MGPRFNNKVALVTGGGTGIGAAIAVALANAGAELTITGRRPGPLSDLAAIHPRLHPLARATSTAMPTKVPEGGL